MAMLNLDILTNVNANRNNASIFTDLQLDLQLNSTFNNQLTKSPQITDLQVNNNLGAIFNSISNIILTQPGQKPLNPVFGIGFNNMLFLPVTQDRAMIIGNAVLDGIKRFEPRVNVININVKPNEEQQQYTISVTITVPRFSTQQVTIVGSLDKTGFYKN